MKGETKEERFKRVVQKRVQNVLDSLRRLSQCSNKRMYVWNDEQLTKIWAAIDKWRAKYRTKKFTKDAMRGFFDIKFNGKRKKDDIDLDDLWDKK